MDKRVIRIFLDTNILMDAVEPRKFTEEAKVILSLCNEGKLEACAATMSFATMAYLLRHHAKEQIHEIFSQLCSIVKVMPVTTEQFEKAMEIAPVRDFEDLMQYECAVFAGADVIITNNGGDFTEFSKLPVVSSRDFLLHYFQQEEQE